MGTFLNTLARSHDLRITFSKSCFGFSGKRQLMMDFGFVFGMESCHVIGLAILVFAGLPHLDTAHALVITNCMAFIPSLLLIDSNIKRKGTGKVENWECLLEGFWVT